MNCICVPKESPIWLSCLIYCWIRKSNISLVIFTSLSVMSIGPYQFAFYCLVLSYVCLWCNIICMKWIGRKSLLLENAIYLNLIILKLRRIVLCDWPDVKHSLGKFLNHIFYFLSIIGIVKPCNTCWVSGRNLHYFLTWFISSKCLNPCGVICSIHLSLTSGAIVTIFVYFLAFIIYIFSFSSSLA